MGKLTKKQIAHATAEWAVVKGTIEDLFNAVAPHLQLPIQAPTYEEVKVFLATISAVGPVGALQQLIFNRNKAAELEPKDARVDVVTHVLRERSSTDSFEALAKRVLAALDEDAAPKQKPVDPRFEAAKACLERYLDISGNLAGAMANLLLRDIDEVVSKAGL